MPSFTYLAAALALTGAVVASPVEKRDAFEVKQVAHGLHRKNGPAQIAKTLRKYGKAVPATSKRLRTTTQLSRLLPTLAATLLFPVTNTTRRT